MSKETKTIGIDLGTTNCCVAASLRDKVVIVPNNLGHYLTPSFVSFDDDECKVGQAAVDQMGTNGSRTVFGAKRLIGRKFNSEEVQKDLGMFPFRVINERENPVIQVKRKGENIKYSPEEISCILLKDLKASAEAFLGTEIHDAVITIPAYFNLSQRQATKNASIKAGFENVSILSEPTAAAIGFGIENRSDEEKKLFVFDLGGGTFDVSILSIKGKEFNVLSIAGDTHLGGEDIDQLLMNHCIMVFECETGIDISNDFRALIRLRKACERAKCTLSTYLKAHIEIMCLSGTEDFVMNLTRDKFENICFEFFSKTITLSKQVLIDASTRPSDVAEVILVGGSTRIPKIREMISKLFRKEPKRTINPDEAVAIGAALQANALKNLKEGNESDIILHNITPFSLGIDTAGGLMEKIVWRNSSIPSSNYMTFYTSYDDQTEMEIEILEGERTLSKNNNILGTLNLENLPPARRGITSVTISLEIDNEGLIKAKSTSDDKEDTVVVEDPGFGLSAKEIAYVHSEVAKYKLEDEIEESRANMFRKLKGYIFRLRDASESRKYNKKTSITLMKLFISSLKELTENEDASEETLKTKYDALKDRVRHAH